MGKIAWRSVRDHPVRFGMSVLVVVLGVAFVSGTFLLRSMMSTTFDNIVDSAYIAQAYVRGEAADNAQATQSGNSQQGTGASSSRASIKADLAENLTQLPGVRAAIPNIAGTLVLVKADGTAAARGGSPTIAYGVDPADPSMTAEAGRLPTAPGEIMLESTTMAAASLAVGDSTTIILGGTITKVEVVGEWKFPAAVAGANIVGLDLKTATAAFAPDGLVADIAVYGAAGASEQSVRDEVADALAGDGVQVVTGQELRDETSAQIESALGFISTFLIVFAAVALVVGGFIIANTFTMVVRQRLREIAVLRAVGASPRQVFGSVVGQAAIIGAIGSAFGIGGGVGIVYGLRAVMATMGMEMSSRVPLDTTTVAVSVATGVLVCVVSAAIPARQAARVAPVDAMREVVSIKESGLILRGVVGAVLVAGGVGGVAYATTRSSGGGPWLGFGGAAILVGMLVMAPAVTRPIVAVLSFPWRRMLRPVGGLAADNVARNPRRSAATSGALMIGMALVGAASVLAASVQASVGSLIDDSLRANFVVTSADYTTGVPSAVVPELRELPDVGAVDAVWYITGTIAGKEGGIVAIDRDVIPNSVDADVVSGSLAGFAGENIVANKAAAELNGWEPGSVISVGLAAADGTVETYRLTVAAVVDLRVVNAAIIVPEQWYQEHVPTGSRYIDSLFVRTVDGAGQDEARAQIAGVLKPYVVLSVMDKDEYSTSLANQVQQMLTVLYALLALSIIIAILGIVNTLALSIMERTREIGLLRAVGMGRLQLSGVVVLESVLIAVFGAVGGLAVGVGVAAAMPSVFESSGFTDLSIPWLNLAWMILFAALVGLVAAVWPAIRAARMPVLRALATE